jgi:hypothetical protein
LGASDDVRGRLFAELVAQGLRGRFQLFVTQMSARKAMTTAMDEKAALTCRFVSFADAG